MIVMADQPQHMQALAQANKVRLARAELKHDIAIGAVAVADVLLNVPWEADSMAIADLLMSQHRWGRTRCRRILRVAAVNETKPLGEMTARQRKWVAELVVADMVRLREVEEEVAIEQWAIARRRAA